MKKITTLITLLVLALTINAQDSIPFKKYYHSLDVLGGIKFGNSALADTCGLICENDTLFYWSPSEGDFFPIERLRENIYNTNGVLTSNRVLTTDGKSLKLVGDSIFYLYLGLDSVLTPAFGKDIYVTGVRGYYDSLYYLDGIVTFNGGVEGGEHIFGDDFTLNNMVKANGTVVLRAENGADNSVARIVVDKETDGVKVSYAEGSIKTGYFLDKEGNVEAFRDSSNVRTSLKILAGNDLILTTGTDSVVLNENGLLLPTLPTDSTGLEQWQVYRNGNVLQIKLQ